MSELRFRYETIEFGDQDIHVRGLRDTQEYSDDDGQAEALGIPSASWALFGILWGGGRALAHLMSDYDVGERRTLEVGCGLGLASLVLNRRNVDITATDIHPSAAAFLQANTELNGDAEIPFVRTGWVDADCGMGTFDLIIAGDTLYESSHPQELSDFMNRYANPKCEVILIDPGRGETGRVSKRMQAHGFSYSREKIVSPPGMAKPFKGFVHTFLRDPQAA